MAADPQPTPSGTRFRRALRSPLIALDLPLVVGVTGCLLAGWFELTRALGGREVAWVYVVEWPLFAVVGGYIWWRLRWGQPDDPARGGAPRRQRRPDAESIASDDPDLIAWHAYLLRLQALDPPGGPPNR